MRHLCGSLCILVYKNADVDNCYSKSLRSMAKVLYSDLKMYYNVFRGTENIFCDITYFPHKCATFDGSLCILVYKNADVDNFYSKSMRTMAKVSIQILGVL